MLLVTERRRLPNRRHHEVLEFHHNGRGFTLGLGNYDDGLIGEIFLTAHKSGGDLEALARDAAIIISVALQHGAPLEIMRNALTRDYNGGPATLIAAALDAALAKGAPSI